MQLRMTSTIAPFDDTRTALANDFDIVPMEQTEGPVFLSVAFPKASHVTGLKPRLPAGRGMSQHQAMFSAAAEALELRASLAVNSRRAHHDLFTSQKRKMLFATDLLSGERVAVPAQRVFLDCASVYREATLHDADSTGCAAGTTLEEATMSALLECIERDAMAIWWYGKQSRPHVEPEILDLKQPRLTWWLESRERETRLIDITSNIGVPVVAAISSETDGSTVAIGTAAKSTLEEAAVAAVTEMVQTEVAIKQAMEADDQDCREWLRLASTHTQPQFLHDASTGFPRDSETDTKSILVRMSEQGLRALSVELTLPGDPLQTVRVMVPGFCAMRRQIISERILAHVRHKEMVSEFEAAEPF
jgi:thiazole/oxazole-forming peptide maturase SagD family component